MLDNLRKNDGKLDSIIEQKGECKFPPFDVIVERCKKKMEQKFKEYGNNWETTNDPEFWKQRLQGELDEIKEKIGRFGSYETAMECVDLINICSMIYTNQMKSHCEWLALGRHGD